MYDPLADRLVLFGGVIGAMYFGQPVSTPSPPRTVEPTLMPAPGLALGVPTDNPASGSVAETTRKAELQAHVREYVLKGAEVHTDALRSYIGLNDEYTHQVIDHAECYAKGRVHTNGLENFWSLLKRGLGGTYVSVEPFHFFRYLDEQAFRFNERKDNDKGRFLKAIASFAGKRLMYSKLIGQEGGGGSLPPAEAWQTA